MTNLCNTFYKIVGHKEEIAHLYNKLSMLKSMHDEYEDDILLSKRHGLPIPTPPKGLVYLHIYDGWIDLSLETVARAFKCRNRTSDCTGCITNFRLLDDTTLYVATESVDCEKNIVWDIVKANYLTLNYYYYIADEESKRFINSDVSGKYFPMRYYVSQYDSQDSMVPSEAELFEDIAARMGADSENMSEFDMLNYFVESHNSIFPDRRIAYYKFQQP